MLPQVTKRRAVGCVILVIVITCLGPLNLQVSRVSCSAVGGVGSVSVCVCFLCHLLAVLTKEAKNSDK